MILDEFLSYAAYKSYVLRSIQVLSLVAAPIALFAYVGRTLHVDGQPFIAESSNLYAADTALTVFLASLTVFGMSITFRRFLKRRAEDNRLRRMIVAPLPSAPNLASKYLSRVKTAQRARNVFGRCLQDLMNVRLTQDPIKRIRYTRAEKDDLRLIARWSDENAVIGALECDRVSLYQRWYAVEPRSFWIMWEDGWDGVSEPLGCSIILPLTASGIRVIRMKDKSAIDLEDEDIVSASSPDGRPDLLIDTWLTCPGFRLQGGLGLSRMTRLLGLHLFSFNEGDDINIWFEPDHPIIQEWGRLDGIMERHGAAHLAGSYTYRFNLAEALRATDPGHRLADAPPPRGGG